jgi:hypothetical protein
MEVCPSNNLGANSSLAIKVFDFLFDRKKILSFLLRRYKFSFPIGNYHQFYELNRWTIYLSVVYKPARCYDISKYIFTWIHMLISCSESKRGPASLSMCVSLCGGMVGVRQQWKRMTAVDEAMMMWCSVKEGGKMKRDWVVERVAKFDMIFL